MLLGTFDSTTGIYKIEDRHFKPIWYANSLREPNVKTIYNTCIAGYNSSHSELPNWPKSVFVTYAPRWNKIKIHYAGLYSQSQLHFFDPSVSIGSFPAWALPWSQNAFVLIHEYAPGQIAWLRDESKFDNDVYIFFEDSPPPEDLPAVIPPAVIPAFTKINITGSIGDLNIDLNPDFKHE